MGFEVLKLLNEFGKIGEVIVDEENKENPEPVTIVDYRYSCCNNIDNSITILFVCRKLIDTTGLSN